LAHFTIEKLDLIIGYNTAVGDDDYIEFIIYPTYEYIL